MSLKIFDDGGGAIKYSILLFSLIGLFVALHRWIILIGKFGSIQDVIINAAVVYRFNVQGEIKEFIPILPIFIYVGVFLSGIYTAYKGKSSYLSFLPIITIILKELTLFWKRRNPILLQWNLFLLLFYSRHLLNTDSNRRFKFSKANALITTILFACDSYSSILIYSSKQVSAKENYVGTDRNLRQLEGKCFILTFSLSLSK
ncbi:MAG: hypothetical protein MZV64_38805 [Ignavibacteriales bacterium]|nr:hypothetical protein [Ignavibacteriales bacterium]